MLKVKLVKRYSINQVLQHPYFTGDYTKISNIFPQEDLLIIKAL